MKSPKDRMSKKEVIKELKLIKNTFVDLRIHRGRLNQAQLSGKYILYYRTIIVMNFLSFFFQFLNSFKLYNQERYCIYLLSVPVYPN